MNTELKSMTITELEALAYRTLVNLDQLQLGLREINTELASRRQPTPDNIGYKPQNATETKNNPKNDDKTS